MMASIWVPDSERKVLRFVLTRGILVTMSGIPTPAELRAKLQLYDLAELRGVAAKSGVPYTTAWKVRSGDIANPGLETARKLWPVVRLRRKASVKAAATVCTA